MSKITQYLLSESSPSSMPSSHSYTVMSHVKSTQNDDDDDDICPVCESECTCKNNSILIPKPSQQTRIPPSTAAPVSAPLKIKLPPRALFQNSASIHSNFQALSTKRACTKRPKQKRTTVDSVTANGTLATTSRNYVLVHHRSSSTFSSTTRDPAGIKPVSTSHILCDSSPLTPESELEPIPHHKRKNTKEPRKKSTASVTRPSARRQSIMKRLSYTPRTQKSEDATWLSPASRRKGKLPLSEDSDYHYSNDEIYVTNMVMHSDDGGDVHLPTHVGTISGPSDNDITTSIADSFDSDSSAAAEEEELILSEEQRTKVRYELLKIEESWHMDKRKWDHLRNSNSWEIRPRKRSVGPEDSGTDSTTESGSEMEIDEDEEEEGEGDEEDDPDIEHGRGLVTGWRSSDDEDFDAELFFTTLTDSSGPGSDADIEDVEDSGDETDKSDLSSISLREAVAAGLLHSSSFDTGCSLVVTEDWDGRLVFTNDLKDGHGVLDVHFEVSAAQRQRSIREAMEVDTASSLLSVENDKENEEDEEDLVTDDGETTDDVLNQETPHVVPLPIRFPTPPVVSIDPLSTLSPIVQSKRSRFPVPVNSPKPADILAGVGKLFPELSSSTSQRSRSASVDAQSVPGTSASSQQSRQPRMGSFVALSRDSQRSVIIDGTASSPFSPFPRTRSVGKGRGRKRIMVNNDAQHPLKRTRQASLPSNSRISTAGETDDPVVQSSPELPLPTSIGLDDVLDASFLDSDDSAFTSVMTFDNHLRNLTRWDHVPVSTFRRSRMADVGMLTVIAPPSDGVSYGSTGGHVYRSPGSVPLWLRDKPLETRTPGSVAVSPVIFPVRAGEQLAVLMEEFQDTSVENSTGIGGAKSHKQKRKEKKKRVQLAKAKVRAEQAATFSASPTFPEFSSLPTVVPPLSL